MSLSRETSQPRRVQHATASNGETRDAVTGDGHIGFQVKANSAGIWVLDGPGKIGEDGAFLR